MNHGCKGVVLVTGGAGFVGSHAVVKLLETGSTVVVLDNLCNSSSPGEEYPTSLRKVREIVAEEQGQQLHFIKGNYGNEAVLEKIFTDFDVKLVIHFAGLKCVPKSKKMPLEYYRNNVSETLILLDRMRKHGVKKLIFSSSSTVYTDAPSDQMPLSEESAIGKCKCPYANTKIFIETILQDLVACERDWKIVALRYFNPTGAHESGKLGEDPRGTPNNLMPYIAQVAIGRRSHLPIFGGDYPTPDGSCVRDFAHVMDVAEGHVAVANSMPGIKDNFRVFNLGTGRPTSVLEMVQAFEKANGVEIPVKMCERRAGDKAMSYCDPTRAWTELGWKSKRNIHDMCKDLWKFQKLNPNGYVKADI